MSSRRITLFFSYAGALLLLTACSGPSITVPPTPTRDPSAVKVVSSHQHGQGGPGGRLVTKYGGPIAVTLTTQPPDPEPQAPITVTYALKEAAGAPVTEEKLLVTHERLMHMFVVSEDLGFFAHVHPKHAGNGQYTLTDTVPASGRYVLFNNFVTPDGNMQVERDVIVVGPSDRQNPAVLVPSLGEAQQIGGLTVLPTVDVQKVRRRTPATFTLNVQQDGKPVTDMEPYLGAACHVVIISADTKQFEHTHGDVEGGAMSGDMSAMPAMAMPTPPASFGPNLQFTHTFMQAGMYRVWSQFQHRGEVFTVGYNVQVLK